MIQLQNNVLIFILLYENYEIKKVVYIKDNVANEYKEERQSRKEIGSYILQV
jgi:hypothetical protein